MGKGALPYVTNLSSRYSPRAELNSICVFNDDREDSSLGFGGVYVGSITDPNVKEAVEACDLTVLVGSLKSDFNTGEFSYKIKSEQTIELHSDYCQVQYAREPSFLLLLPSSLFD
jgi:TPP-dependent 2-oxoacid decarboxylase